MQTYLLLPLRHPGRRRRSAEDGHGIEHFSIKDIIRAEKAEGKKRRRKRPDKGTSGVVEREVELGPEGWKMNVRDWRFNVLHSEPDFAIDPSNPQYIILIFGNRD